MLLAYVYPYNTANVKGRCADKALYRDAITSVVPHQVRFPLAGLGIGEQLAWYHRHAGALERGTSP